MVAYEGTLDPAGRFPRRAAALALGVLIAAGGVMASCEEPVVPIKWRGSAPAESTYVPVSEAAAATQAAHSQAIAEAALAGAGAEELA